MTDITCECVICHQPTKPEDLHPTFPHTCKVCYNRIMDEVQANTPPCSVCGNEDLFGCNCIEDPDFADPEVPYPKRLTVSDFAMKQNTADSGNSYTDWHWDSIRSLVSVWWPKRIAGAGEGECLDRKVLVPLPAGIHYRCFCPSRVKLQIDMKVEARVVARQEGEAPYIQTFVTKEEAAKFGWQPTVAKDVKVVCYSREALLENGGTLTHPDSDWEIVTILCSDNAAQEPMEPLTMARNFLEMTGGTKSEYTAAEFAQAIWHHSQRGLRVMNPWK